MRPDRPLVGVGADEHVEAGALEAERQAAGAAEEVDRGRTPSSAHVASDGRQIGRLRALWVTRRARWEAPVMRDLRTPSRVGSPFHRFLVTHLRQPNGLTGSLTGTAECGGGQCGTRSVAAP